MAYRPFPEINIVTPLLWFVLIDVRRLCFDRYATRLG